MTAATETGVLGRSADWAASPALLWRAAAWLSLAALWLLGRSYAGITHDARLYIGAVMARLFPETIGRDLMFVHDGQFGFTAFGAAAQPLVEALGPSSGALLLAAAGAAVWFAAAAFLVTRLVRGAEAWVVLAALAVLPGSYGYEQVLRYGEAFATPRPFAEAGVMLAVGLLIAGRRWAALAPLTLAALFHPVMALTGFAVFFFVMAWEDRRWWAAAVLAMAAALAAAAAGLPLAERLLQRMDPEWFEVVWLRSPVTVLAAWPAENFGRIVVHAVTAGLAAALLHGRSRLVFGAVVAVALAGVAASALFGDLLRSVLMLQIQTWRALWLLAAVAALGAGVCLLRLWPLGWPGRLVLAALAVAWTGLDDLLFGAPAALLALAAFAGMQRGLSVSVAKTAAVCLAFVAGVRFLGGEAAWWSARFLNAGHLPADVQAAPLGWLPLAHAVIAVGCGLFVLAVRRFEPAGPTGRAAAPAAVLAAGLFATALAGWDQRAAVARAVEQAPGGGAVRAAITTAPGPVLWLGGEVAPWTITERPGWWAPMQGAPVVFSRELAMEWRRRHEVLVGVGLAGPLEGRGARERREAAQRPAPQWTPRKLAALCLRSDAPAWIVVPLREGAEAPEGTAALWRPGVAEYETTGRRSFARLQGHAVARCAVGR